MAGLGQSLKKALFVLVVLLACSTKPVRGFPFEWWRVRVWEGKFYYIYRSGYWQELMEWETESLQEAFISEPEMAVYITGQSQMNWGNVGDWPPYWNVESQQWSFCGRTPHTHMHLADPIDLWQIWPGPKPETGSWKDWQDVQEEATKNASKWHCKWEEEMDPSASSSSRPARGQSRGRSPSQPAKGSVPWSHRYLTRGFHSQQRREERLRLEKEGKPVPAHLMPNQIKMCKELKKQMWMLQQQQKTNAAKPEEAEPEEMKPEEAAEVPDVPMEPAPPEDAAMPERGRSRRPSLNRGRMGPRSLTPAMGRGTPAQPGVQGSFLKPEVQEEEEECEEEEEEEQDDEMAKPVEAEGQKKQTNARKEKSLQRLRLKSKKNLRTTRKILMVVMVVALHHLQKSHHCLHLHSSQIFLHLKSL